MSAPKVVGVSLAARRAERLARLPAFSAKDYLTANPDLARAGVDPLDHAVSSGLQEGRAVLSELAIARDYARVAAGEGLKWRVTAPRSCPKPRCTVFVSSFSDEGYRAFAASLTADLAGAGFPASMKDERADHRADHGLMLFVAAHQFLTLGHGPLWRDPEISGTGFVVLDDAIGSPTGDRSLEAVLEARGVLDTSAVGASVWTEGGLPNVHLTMRAPLRSRWLDAADLAHPLMRAAPPAARRLDCHPAEAGERPLDVLSFAPEASRRNMKLGRIAPSLARHRCFVYAQQGASTEMEERLNRTTHWRIAGHLSAQSRLTLNLSAGALPVLDRRRIVAQAMAGGSVVVSDARFVESGLEAGVHYFTEDARHLGALIDWALLDPEGRATVEQVREQAFDRLAALNGDPRRFDGVGDFLLAAATDGGSGR